MGKTTDTRWESLTRNDEGGSVGSEVEEELGEGEAGKLATGAEMGVVTSDDTEHERSDEETTDLNGLATDNLDKGNGEEVTRNVTGGGDDQVTVGVDEKSVVLVATLGETNGCKEDRLVQVDTVESNIDEEPGGSSTDEDLSVSPLGEVVDESSPLGLLGLVSELLLKSDLGSLLLGSTAVASLGKVEGGGRRVDRSIGNGVEFTRLLELARLGHGETEVEADGTRNESQTELETPDTVELTVVTVG